MPLELLVLLVGVGLLLIFVAVHLLGGGTMAANLDRETAAARMRLDHPEFKDQHIVRDSMGRGVILLQGRQEPVGLVWGRNNARLLNRSSLRSFSIEGPQLTLNLNDWKTPNVALLIDDDDDLASIRLALEAALNEASSA